MNNVKTEEVNIKLETAQETQDCSYQEQTTTKAEPKFCCPYPDCSKAFRFYCDTKRHLSTHSSKRPYACTYPGCSKAFKRSDTLKLHEKSHTIPTSHICPFPDCSVQYNTKAALKSHLRKHKMKKETCCLEECEKIFLKSHERSDLNNVNKCDNDLDDSEESHKKIKFEENHKRVKAEENTHSENSSLFHQTSLGSVWDQEDQTRFLKCLNAVQNDQRHGSAINYQQNWLLENKASNKLVLIDLLKTLTQENQTLENQIKNIESLLKK